MPSSFFWMGEMRAVGGAHVVFDPLGFESFDESFDVLVRDEPSVLVGFGGNANLVQAAAAEADGERGGKGRKPRSQYLSLAKLLAKNGCLTTKRSASFFYIDKDKAVTFEDMEAVMEMVRAGEVEIPIKAVWDLENIREPHENWGKVPGMGSCLVRVNPDA